MARREQESRDRYISDERYAERQQKNRQLQEWQDFQNPGFSGDLAGHRHLPAGRAEAAAGRHRADPSRA